MVINALNCGASTFMADFEDANCPTWDNMIDGPGEPARRGAPHDQPSSRPASSYRLNDKTAVLIPRPRGWHLDEKHVTVDGKPVSGALFDFGLYFFHNAKELLARGSGPYYYLPKMESHLEARLWNDIFVFAQKTLGIAARLGARHGADRDAARGVRDGRDPLGAARALRGPQHRPLGLHLLLHQETPLPPRVLPRRPRAGDDDLALHARLRAAAREDLPPPQRAGDGRHGGADPDQERPGRQRGGDGEGARRQGARGDRRLRRHLGRAPGPGADREGGLRQAHAGPEPVLEAAPRRERDARRTCSTSSPRRRSPRRACATTSRSASSTSARGSRATAACRSST